MRIRLSAVVLLCAAAIAAEARQFAQKETVSFEYPIAPNGTVVIENAFGSVNVIGTDHAKIYITGEKVVKGVDDAAIADGKRLTQTQVVGTDRVRVIRTLFPKPDPRWTSAMNYTVRIPRTASVKVVSNASEQIRIAEIRGSVSVQNVAGQITLERLGGGVAVETINGNITMHATAQTLANATLLSVNGKIEVHAPDNANIQWEGEVIGGDVRTTFAPRVQFQGTKFRGLINGPISPGSILTTNTVAGTVYVLRSGTNEQAAQSIRSLAGPVQQQLVVGPIVRPVVVERVYSVQTQLGDVAIGEIRGSADIATRAGEIRLGTVAGRCNVFSGGGPLNLGDIVGFLNAKTEGGDVLVQAAREGGVITTGGGTIRLLFTSGPTRLISGGGDIVVRQTTGPIHAETKSGDITVSIDAATRSLRVGARTAKGNVILNLPMRFAADVDATIVTSDPNIHQVRSELGNLSVQREQLPGGKTRIRATGKINGGGERIELYAQEGGIQISTSPR
jgi:DUF4097 and DUF4098 domain-containing protein YvlB